MRHLVHPSVRPSAIAATLILLLGACGGSSDDATADAEPEEAPSVDASDGDDTAAEPADDADGSAEGEDDGDGPGGGGDETYEPGPVSYRVVNFLDQPVDLYVRTQGLVKAFEAELGVQPGAVTDFFAPPTDGAFVITAAGSGDPECVASCDHILANLTAFDTDGPIHTVVLHDRDGSVGAFDLWEDPSDDSTNSNAMPPADPALGLVVITAIDVTDADFGLRVGFVGTEGCIDPVANANILVGGNQTPVFAIDGPSTEIVLFDNQDRECVDPVGGPFTVAGGAGDRSHLVLTGSPGALDAAVVPFAASGATSPAGAADEEASGDYDLAVSLMASELAAEIGLDDADAACLASYVVDAIGVDVALPGGELVDLDSADEATQSEALDGVIAGVEGCGIDPSLLGG